MQTIFKYPMQLDDRSLALPRGAVIRRFAMQHGVPTVWAEVDSNAPTVTRRVQIFGTGHPLPEGAVYLGSCDHGQFVWHLFETF